MTNRPIDLTDAELDHLMSLFDNSPGPENFSTAYNKLREERESRQHDLLHREAIGAFLNLAGVPSSSREIAVRSIMDNLGLGGVREAIAFWHQKTLR
ncbi:hypothetical protein SEA_SKOG_71 [Gordonia phage Skog]|uniref:Uncharacterized protein n=1 Tax=Gordonia phage Skog TaxID=2704033 RepID=A0A6G6XKC2_9CAUD|nr:hypothetical protein KHQ85_gp071 [Gordonia phage Skog]QIG58223.1 hypothetical protein SEA_SKOG_71 [Gordonia phage Skog]